MANKISGPAKSSIIMKLGQAARTSDGRIHILRSRGGWVVKAEGSRRAKAVRATKKSAIKYAWNLKTSSIVVHKKDGSVLSNLSK